MPPEFDVIDWYHYKVPGSWSDLAVAAWTQIPLGGLIGLQKSYLGYGLRDRVDPFRGQVGNLVLEVGQGRAYARV